MDLRRQLRDVLWARVVFTLALLMGVLWVQFDDHGFALWELGVAVGVIAIANIPFFLLEPHVEVRSLAAEIMIVDLALVTVAIIYSGGALSSEAIFYVWPIVFATVFLPAWAPYAAAVAAGVLYSAVWGLQHYGRLQPSAVVAEIHVPPNWMLITTCLHVAAFLLVALLAGRLATALMRSTLQISRSKADTEAQLRRMQATNEQLRAMSESSRVFLRHHDVEGLMPEALAQIAEASGMSAGFALVLSRNSGEYDERARHGRVDESLVRKMRELGLAEAAKAGVRLYEEVTDPQIGRLLKAAEKAGFHGMLVAPLEAKNEVLGVICLLYGKDHVVADSAVPTLGESSSEEKLPVAHAAIFFAVSYSPTRVLTISSYFA